MVRKRNAETNPLTAEEREEVAVAVYKEAFDQEPDAQMVREELDNRDWDAAATEDDYDWMTRRAVQLWDQAQTHPGWTREIIEQIAAVARRLAPFQPVERHHVLDAAEKLFKLPVSEDDIETIQELATRVHLYAFVPGERSPGTAESVEELLQHLDFTALYQLAGAALTSMAVLGSDREWEAAHLEWVAVTLEAGATTLDIPTVSDQDVAVANWWRRLMGSRDPLDAEGNEVLWEPGLREDEDEDIQVWSPEDPENAVPENLRAAAAEFVVVQHKFEDGSPTIYEWKHHSDPLRGGWAIPHPDHPLSADVNMAVRRCSPEQWEEAAPDQADTLDHAKDAVLHHPPAAFETGSITEVADFLADPTRQ